MKCININCWSLRRIFISVFKTSASSFFFFLSRNIYPYFQWPKSVSIALSVSGIRKEIVLQNYRNVVNNRWLGTLQDCSISILSPPILVDVQMCQTQSWWPTGTPSWKYTRVYIYSFPGNKSPFLKLLRFASDIFLSLVSVFISSLLSVWRCSHLDSQTATDTSKAHVMLRGRGHHTGSHKTVCHLFLVLTVANWQSPYICRTHQKNITLCYVYLQKTFETNSKTAVLWTAFSEI